MSTANHKPKSRAQGSIREVIIPVAGMSCAACVRKVEKALTGLAGVREANVNLALGKAGVVFEPETCDITQMQKVIEDVGYEVPAARIELLVLGMTPGHCEHVIGRALRSLPGVRDVQFNFATDTVTVEYLDSVVSAAEIKKTIRSLGYEVHDKGEGEAGLDRERQLRQAELRRQLINMLIAWPLGLVVMLFTFSDYAPLSSFMPAWVSDKLLLFALTTPWSWAPAGSSSSTRGTACGAASPI